MPWRGAQPCVAAVHHEGSWLQLPVLPVALHATNAGSPASHAKPCRKYVNNSWCAPPEQAFDADVLVGDVAYACAMGLSELLRRDAPDLARRGRLPRVMVSALPILDPLVPGRMENLPNSLAYIPQMGTTFSNRMVRAHACPTSWPTSPRWAPPSPTAWCARTAPGAPPASVQFS